MAVLTETQSARLFEEARRLMPGGVSSPVRAMRSVGRDHPLFLARGAGGEVWDADGPHSAHRRVDAAGDQARRSAPAVGQLPQSHPARSFAQYVTIVPAPARLIAVSASRAAARSSRCPASAAARTIAYSPETW